MLVMSQTQVIVPQAAILVDGCPTMAAAAGIALAALLRARCRARCRRSLRISLRVDDGTISWSAELQPRVHSQAGAGTQDQVQGTARARAPAQRRLKAKHELGAKWLRVGVFFWVFGRPPENTKCPRINLRICLAGLVRPVLFLFLHSY